MWYLLLAIVQGLMLAALPPAWAYLVHVGPEWLTSEPGRGCLGFSFMILGSLLVAGILISLSEAGARSNDK